VGGVGGEINFEIYRMTGSKIRHYNYSVTFYTWDDNETFEYLK
jgi:hypothetical protein